jgi:two-component system OmpR family sensor kinase
MRAWVCEARPRGCSLCECERRADHHWSSGRHAGPSGELVQRVRSRGPGVAAAVREAIFSRFVRGSAGLASPHRGSGIGLSVVRLLIEAMGGRVQVVAHPGGGADFQLLLPEWANP